MKRLLALFAGLLATATLAHAQTTTSHAPEYYAQASALAVFPGHFDNVAGGSVAGGITFAGQHSAELEAIYFRSDSDTDPSAHVKFIPVLATYKYRQAINDKLSGYFGVSVGATIEDGRLVYTYYSLNQTRSAFTYGGQLGLAYTLTPRLSLDLGGKILHLEGTSLATDGNIATVGLGLNVRL